MSSAQPPTTPGPEEQGAAGSQPPAVPGASGASAEGAGHGVTPVEPQFVNPAPTPPPPPPPSGQTASPPVCPRHPSVVSHIRCQRCEQPVCVECQRPAAVGVQCVTCVGQDAAAHPAHRSRFGGVLYTEKPVVTWWIMGICGVVFVLQYLTSGQSFNVTRELFFMPYLGQFEPWRFLTGAFVHSPSTLTHIAFNMFMLWQFGTMLERYFGQREYLALYLLSALGGHAMILLLASPPQSQAQMQTTAWLTPTVGASGAIFGLFAAMMLCAREDRQPLGGFAVLLGINVVFSLWDPRISWQGHLGGFLVGLAVAALLLALRSPERRRLQWAALGGSLVVLVALIMLRYAVADGSFLTVLQHGGVGF